MPRSTDRSDVTDPARVVTNELSVPDDLDNCAHRVSVMSSGSSARVSSCLNIATAIVIVHAAAPAPRNARLASAEPTSHRPLHGGTVLIVAALVLSQASNAVGWRS